MFDRKEDQHIIELLTEIRDDARAYYATVLGTAPPAPGPGPTPPPPPTPTATVAWINQSQGSLSDADAAKIVEALNIQAKDVKKAWGDKVPGNVTHVNATLDTLPPSCIKAYFLPTADVANALGYHDVDPQGDPYIRVFVETILSQSGATALTGTTSVAQCAGHEGPEWECDPLCQTYSMPRGDGTKVAIEVGDPVEASGYDVKLTDGSSVTVSNFVFPSFFDPAGTAPYDQMGLVTKPFEIMPGGYEIVQDASGNVTQVFGKTYAAWRKETKLHPSSRTAKRLAKAQ